MKKLFLVMLAILPSAAYAQDDGKYPPECRFLESHKPSNDVTYQPGVDVRGKAVVPADINAPPMGLDQQTIVIPLTIDLAKRLQNNNVQGLELNATPGYLEVSPSGKVLYNGRDLTAQLQAVCDEKSRETPPSAAPVADRQTAPDVIESAPVKEIAPKPAAKPVTPPPAPVVEAPKEEPKPVEGELLEGGEYAD